MFGVEAFPAVAFFFLLVATPRSPRWLVSQRNLEEAREVLTRLGSDKGNALLQTIVVGGTNLLFTMIALTMIDLFGRKKLMLVGSIEYILSLGATAWAFCTYQVEFDAVTQSLKAVAEAETAGATQSESYLPEETEPANRIRHQPISFE